MEVRTLVGLTLSMLTTGCFLRASRTQEVRFDPLTITGDPELDKLNDEELFLAGTTSFAADEFRLAARYFGRIADFHPNSKHRRAALYNAGLALERLKLWEEAHGRFLELSDAERGVGDALDAAFRVAETLYHLERYKEAAEILNTIGQRADLPISRRLEAQVQKGVCELESGESEQAESTLRKALGSWHQLEDKDQVDDYFPAQAQFFLGEVYRLHFEGVQLDPAKGVDQLAKDLEYKAELLLSAQGHYLRSIRMGNGYWATASGARVGELYESLYEHMIHSPAPRELNGEEADIYRQELRKKIRVLLTKAITVYERTLEAAERIGSSSVFVDRTRQSLKKVKDLLLADAQAEEAEEAASSGPKPKS